jgi:hypothetical protein
MTRGLAKMMSSLLETEDLKAEQKFIVLWVKKKD